MNDVTHYTHCPVCGSAALQPVFQVKDQTVSGLYFLIVECKACTLRFTQDVPGPAAIGAYYKSDSYISHSNTATGIVNRLYHWVRKRTIVRKRKLLQQYTGLNTGRLLDIGSGVGTFVQEMKSNGWETTGLEPDDDARKIASQQYQVELSTMDQFYKLQAGSFDAITMWHVLEHVHDLQSYVQQLHTLLSENGKIFIAVPNYTAGDARVYKENWAAYDVPRHLYHFSPQSIKLLMERHGLKVNNYLPMWYDSFYISLLSSRYKNGKTNWPGAVLNGIRSNLSALTDTRKCSSVIYVISR